MIICGYPAEINKIRFVTAHNPIGPYIRLCLRGLPVMGYSGRLDR
jgi:hypothetical protein